jgi:hypothetical protein
MSLLIRTIDARQRTPFVASGTGCVSVVIPCFNYAHYLPDSIGSVLAQEGVEVDVIVVDDASTDDSIATARAFDSRIRILANEINSGPVITFNRGLAQAQGEFIVRLDADDLLTPGSLLRAVALMQAEPDVGLVYGHPLHFSGETRPAARTTATSWTIWKGTDWLAARCAAGNNVITSPEVVMRRSIVERVGGQRSLAHTHDMEMWLRIAAYADVAYVNGADQAWHREHVASLSTQAQDPLVILTEIRDAFDVLFMEVGPDVPGSDQLHAHARRAVARQALAYARRDLDRGVVSADARRLAKLALSCDPEIVDLPEGRSFAAARGRAECLPRPVAALAGLVPRLRRWLEERRQKECWARTGVYERLLIYQLAEAARGTDEGWDK